MCGAKLRAVAQRPGVQVAVAVLAVTLMGGKATKRR